MELTLDRVQWSKELTHGFFRLVQNLDYTTNEVLNIGIHTSEIF